MTTDADTQPLIPIPVWQRTAVAAAVAVSTLVLYQPAERLFGTGTGLIGIAPIAVIGAFFGIRPAILAGGIVLPFLAYLLDREGTGSRLTDAFADLTLSAAFLLTAWAFGRFHRHWVALTRERAERRSLALRLRAAEQRLGALVEMSHGAMFQLSSAGRLLLVDGEEAIGITASRSDYLYAQLGDLIGEEAARELDAAADRAATSNAPVEVEVQARLPNGLQQLAVTMVAGEDGVVTGLARPRR